MKILPTLAKKNLGTGMRRNHRKVNYYMASHTKQLPIWQAHII